MFYIKEWSWKFIEWPLRLKGHYSSVQSWVTLLLLQPKWGGAWVSGEEKERDRQEKGRREKREVAAEKERVEELKTGPWEPDGPLYTHTHTYIYVCICTYSPHVSHHHFFFLFPLFYLTLKKTNTLVWTIGVCKPANTKSHLHTYRLHKRAALFIIFQISESLLFSHIQMHANIYIWI